MTKTERIIVTIGLSMAGNALIATNVLAACGILLAAFTMAWFVE